MTASGKPPTKPKKEKPPRRSRYDQGPAENSIALRTMVCTMAVFCILISCTYIYTPHLTLMLYVVATVVGSFVSYQCRDQKNKLLSLVVVAGIVAVMVGLVKELWDGFYGSGALDLRGPMVHMVAGTFAVHSFELRGRKAINQSALVGLTLMCLVGPLAKDLIYGVCVIVYICLAGVMLYYECQSRTSQSWLPEPIKGAPVLSKMAVDPNRQRRATGNALVVLCLLPLLSAMVFAILPRGEGTVDAMRLWSQQSLQQALFRFTEDPSHRARFTQDFYTPPRRAANTQHPGSNGRSVIQQEAVKSGANSTAGQASESAARSQQQRIDDENNERGFNIRAPHEKDQSKVIYRVWSDRSLFLRRFCYDTTDGKEWFSHQADQHDRVPIDSRGTYDLSGISTFSQPSSLAFMTQSQKYEVTSDTGQVLALGWVPQRIALDTTALLADPCGEVKAQTRLVTGTKYSVISSVPIYDLKKMRNDAPIDGREADKIRQEMAPYLQLPDSHDDSVTRLAGQLVGIDAANWFTRAERITEYLRNNYRYTMDAKPDSNENAINTFLLKSKAGDCRDFASALVILCRCVGIPARCVGGYAPGDFNIFLGCREVKLLHAHAWAEVYVPPYGWVPFDGIPEGAMPEPEKERGLDLLSHLKEHLPGAKHTTVGGLLEQIQQVALTVFAIIFSIVAGWQIYERWKSWRDYELNVHPASKLYHQILRDLKKLHVVKKESDTPQNVLEHVAQACRGLEQKGKPLPELPDTVNQFIEAYSQCYFGEKSAKLPELQQLRQRIHELVRSI
jgi:transglutaminase-like putative cysteine protease